MKFFFVESYLKTAMENESVIKKQDQIFLLVDIADKLYGRDVLKPILKLFAKLNALFFSLGGGGSLSRLIHSVTKKLNTKESLQYIQKFIDRHPDTTGLSTTAFEEAIETITSNVRWMEDNKESVTAWLKAYLTPAPEPELNYRLPQTLKPYRYEITIKPYFKANTQPETYDGHVWIEFKC